MDIIKWYKVQISFFTKENFFAVRRWCDVLTLLTKFNGFNVNIEQQYSEMYGALAIYNVETWNDSNEYKSDVYACAPKGVQCVDDVYYVSEFMSEKLKALGFPIFQFKYEDEKFLEYGKKPNYGNPKANEYYLCPTLYQVAEWLRKEKDLFIGIMQSKKDKKLFYSIINTNGSVYQSTVGTFEEAMQHGINRCLTILEGE